MRRANSLEKTLMPGKIEGKRRCRRQRMRRLDSITDSMDMNLSKLWETGKDREGHGLCCSQWYVAKSQTKLSNWTTTEVFNLCDTIKLNTNVNVSYYINVGDNNGTSPPTINCARHPCIPNLSDLNFQKLSLGYSKGWEIQPFALWLSSKSPIFSLTPHRGHQRWLQPPILKVTRISQLPRRRQRRPTPVLLPGKSHGRRSPVGCSPWGLEKSDTTERLHFHFSLSCIGEGNGSPLQCSCLENPRDGRAWWAAVCGVAQSRTRLKRLSSSSSTTPLGLFLLGSLLHRLMFIFFGSAKLVATHLSI